MKWESLQQQSASINAQINELEKLKEKKKVIEKQLKIVQIEISKYEVGLKQIKIQLSKAEKHSFFDTLRSFFSKSNVEEQEKLAAIKELKLNESFAIAEEFKHQLSELQQRIDALDETSLHNALTKNILEKKDWLRANEKDRMAELEHIDYEKHLCLRLIKEIDEAIDAGQKAYQAIMNALEEMKKAQDYSRWDTFWGGGVIATKMKYDQIQDTSYFVHYAQMALQNFQNELLDIEELKLHELQIQVHGYIKFFDYFFDDLFSAWKVHEQINYSFEKLQRLIEDVSATIQKLKDKRYHTSKVLSNIEKQMDQLLT